VLVGSSSVPVNDPRNTASRARSASRAALLLRPGVVVMTSHAVRVAGGGEGDTGGVGDDTGG
jgi:hypothetical protein